MTNISKMVHFIITAITTTHSNSYRVQPEVNVCRLNVGIHLIRPKHNLQTTNMKKVTARSLAKQAKKKKKKRQQFCGFILTKSKQVMPNC